VKTSGPFILFLRLGPKNPVNPDKVIRIPANMPDKRKASIMSIPPYKIIAVDFYKKYKTDMSYYPL
jgi:ubiquitin